MGDLGVPACPGWGDSTAVGWLVLAQNQDWAERALLALAEQGKERGGSALSSLLVLSRAPCVLRSALRTGGVDDPGPWPGDPTGTG